MFFNIKKHTWFVVTFLLLIFTKGYADEGVELLEDSLNEVISSKDFQQSKSIVLLSKSFKNQILTMKLDEIQIFNQDSEIILHASSGTSTIKPPLTKYFEGHIENKENSHVFLDFTNNNEIKGIISLENKTYFYENKITGFKHRDISLQEINTNKNIKSDFQCFTEHAGFFNKKPTPLLNEFSIANKDQKTPDNTNTYVANLNLETDYEYYKLFNDKNKAIKYAADLTAYTSSIYKKELKALLKIKKLNIYLTPSNPWQATDITGLLNSLEQHYTSNQINNTTKDAAIHLLSGKRIGGLAYIGSLCNSYTKFGVSGGLYGTFNINQPKIVWDAKVFAHELGHNFGAIHTHTYAPQPIDCCFFESSASICANYEPYTQLPSINSLTGGEPEKGTGTIMSYCHKVTGKLNNISLTLGRNHPYGIGAERVPNDMRSHLLSTKATYPQCLPIYFPGFAKNVIWSSNNSLKSNTLLVGDFNGDNKSDLIDFRIQNKSNFYVSLSDSFTFKNRKNWLKGFPLNGVLPLIGDFNGDAKDDIINHPSKTNEFAILALSTGSTFKLTQEWKLLAPELQGQYLVGDFNGDKRSDLGFLSIATNKFYVATSRGNNFSPFEVWGNNLAAAIHAITIGDFNGDQKDDISFTTNQLPNHVYVSLSSGRKLKIASIWADTIPSTSPKFEVNDFNADGLDDLLYTSTDSKKIYVMLSNKTSFDESQQAGFLDTLIQSKFHVGKFNADNAADILTLSSESPVSLGVMTSLLQ